MDHSHLTRGKMAVSPGIWPVVLLGSHVAAKKGLPSGVRKRFRGQPPFPFWMWHMSMKSPSRSGRSSRSTLTATQVSFMRSATSGSEKHSRSMTWHQWHEE